MKIKIINYFAISSFLIGVILLIVLIFQFSLSGYKFSINEINIEDSSKIVSIIQGLLSTIWLITTISLLFLTFFLQKEELQKTTTSFKIQNEDTHFFNLLNAFLSIRNNVEFSFYVEEFNSENAFPTLNEKTITGSKYFQNIYSWFIMFTEVFKNNGLPRKEKGKYKKALNIIFGIEEDFYKGHIQTIYSKSNKIFYSACSSLYLTLISDHFMNYLNFLKELIQYGEKSENKTNYREYIKSILSIDEKRLLFYFSLSDPKLLELSKELDLFINLHPADLISKDHYIFYST